MSTGADIRPAGTAGDVRALSGPGHEILAKMVRPWLRRAVQYDRVSSYYSPRSLLTLLDELATIWKGRGVVRLVLGFHESGEFRPLLERKVPIEAEVRRAVADALRGNSGELGGLLQARRAALVPTLRRLLQTRALHVRLVTPRVNLEYFRAKGEWPHPEVGTFHSKFAIIHLGLDRSRQGRRSLGGYVAPVRPRTGRRVRFVTLTGSFNESEAAYGHNTEDAVLHRSWERHEEDVAVYFERRFEELWANAATDVVTMPFTNEFTESLQMSVEQARPTWLSWGPFAKAISSSPFYGSLALPNLGLLPHQQRVFHNTLSRWPVRELLADEVGLGKTVEAGAIIQYLLTHGGVRRVLILTPASLKVQWQQELRRHFGLDFWLFDPGQGACLRGPESSQTRLTADCDLTIASWHWARLQAAGGPAKILQEFKPDLLVVDEAHHARLRDLGRGGLESTLLYDLVNTLGSKTPHLLLLTATPFQTSHLDYYSLLSLLRMPTWFKLQELNRFARWTSGDLADDFDWRVRQVRAVRLTAEELAMLSYPRKEEIGAIPPDSSTKSFEDYLESHTPLSKDEVLAVHPTTLFTSRNTRESLKSQGYGFPEAHLLGADVPVNEAQEKWLQELDVYFRDWLCSVESHCASQTAVGRMRSLMRQRAVSSLAAARDSLENRRARLRTFLTTGEPDSLSGPLGPEFDPQLNDEEDSDPGFHGTKSGGSEAKAREQAARLEIARIDLLLQKHEEAFKSQGTEMDPKLVRIKVLVEEHLAAGRKVLVFSRFTSTTRAVVDALLELDGLKGLGRFEGQLAGIYVREGETQRWKECSREEVEDALKTSKIHVLVCSDAASEGLNLHAASVVINVDVPWNPSRLLQRFGRVDRLGQRAPEVFLINAYYPNSIEERMYRVLEGRRMDFVSVLGQVPEIISDQQERWLQTFTGGARGSSLTEADVTEARKRNDRLQFKHLTLASRAEPPSRTLELLESFIESIEPGRHGRKSRLEVVDMTREVLSVDPLNEHFVSWANEAWTRFETTRKARGRKARVLLLQSTFGKSLGLGLQTSGGLYPLVSKHWPAVFQFIFSGTPIPLGKLTRFAADDLKGVENYIMVEEDWIRPRHEFMRCLYNEIPPTPALELASVRSIGQSVRVS
jgi:superfamily II DNA or RNA helicase